MPFLIALTVFASVYALAGCVTFVVTYSRANPCRHDLNGLNAALLMGWLGVWVTTGLAAALASVPVGLTAGLQLCALIGVGTVVWVQVILVFRSRRKRSGGDDDGS